MTLRNDQKEYWNSVADKKNFTTPFDLEEFSKHVNKTSRILDVGCGYGRILNELYKNNYRNLIGIDFSDKLIERGKTLYPNLKLSIQKSPNIDFPDESMDAVILFAVLTCIIDDKEQQKLLAEITRVLKPNGIIYINDFLLNTDERNLMRYEKYSHKYNSYGVFELPEEGAVLRHHSLDYIKKVTSPFIQIKFNRVVYTTMNGHTSNGFFFIGKKTE